MNETIKTIIERRSVRTFKPDQLSEENIRAIIEAGQYAPSAMNEQAWHITAIQNKNLLDKINKVLRTVFLNSGNPMFIERAKEDNFSPFYHSPTLIIVSADAKAIAPEPDASLALGNMLLAAHSLGISSVWIHSLRYLSASDEGKELTLELGIPAGYTIYGSGAFGYNAGEVPDAAPRRQGTVTILK